MCALRLAAVWFALLWLNPAQAHLMAAQKGTLNIVNNAAFLVLSVPVAALQGVDDDGDGSLSKTELALHDEGIRAQIKAGVVLIGPVGTLPLQLMMLDIAPADNAPKAISSQLVVLGRFESVTGDLLLRFLLFGAKAEERAQDITITRKDASQWLRFTPEQTTKAVLPGTIAVFGEYVYIGAIHVLGGADHMLFLLVVLLAGWHWRTLLGMLTCFSVGHALTLAVCVWGGWSVSERIVEPAIAATIVVLAVFDGWSRWRIRIVKVHVRLALVFGCALIHGLGLAGALRELTQWPPGSMQFALGLAGFNVGIELAQIGVAMLVGLTAMGLRRLTGVISLQWVGQLATVVAMVAGTFWFVERVMVVIYQ